LSIVAGESCPPLLELLLLLLLLLLLPLLLLLLLLALFPFDRVDVVFGRDGEEVAPVALTGSMLVLVAGVSDI